MFLDSQKTLDQRGFNAPKIIKNENVNSELCSFKQHHAQVLAESKHHENPITFSVDSRKWSGILKGIWEKISIFRAWPLGGHASRS